MRYYMRDIYDHLLRISDTVSTFRDNMAGVIDLYMSAVSNRLNVVVQRLTVVTIGIGVLTVISGFYGMNFEHNLPPFSAGMGRPVRPPADGGLTGCRRRHSAALGMKAGCSADLV